MHPRTRTSPKNLYWPSKLSFQKLIQPQTGERKSHALNFVDGVENAGVIYNQWSYGYLGSLAANASSELNILGHDGNTLGVNGGQVGIFEKTNKVCLSSLLEGKNSARLESEISLEVLSDLSDETLEWELSDQ